MTAMYFKQRVLTPGPTAVPEAVLLEMAQPIIHHRTKAFQAIFGELSKGLARLFRTSGPVLSIAGSGTTGFEAAQVSMIKPGTKALTVANGKFAERWQDIYKAYGVPQVAVDVPWGQPAPLDKIEAALKANPDVSVVTVVHSETSTCTASDVKAIAALVQKTDAILIVDGITSVGALPVEMDAWGIDVLVTGSQKALMLPPGLAFVGLGARAIARLKDVPKPMTYNLNLSKWLKAHADNDVPFTPPVSLIRGQLVAVKMMEQMGLENIWARTAKLAAASRAAFEAMGLKAVSASPSDSVSGAFYPAGVDDKKFRAAVRDQFGVHIAGGQSGRGGEWEGKIFRISHMGYVDAGDTLAALAGIESVLIGMGHKADKGAALAAAAKVLG